MIQKIKQAVLFSVLLISSTTLQAQGFIEGEHYTRLATPVATQTGSKIEVLDFFWYGCPHCFKFQPTLNQWKKDLPEDVQHIRVPSPMNSSWIPHTKTFYALNKMEAIEGNHQAIFKAIHIDRNRISSKSEIADFLAEQGVDKTLFLEVYESFSVESKSRQALQLAHKYQLRGVPALAINGKYTISPNQAGSYQAMVNIANYLIGLESE